MVRPAAIPPLECAVAPCVGSVALSYGRPAYPGATAAGDMDVAAETGTAADSTPVASAGRAVPTTATTTAASSSSSATASSREGWRQAEEQGNGNNQGKPKQAAGARLGSHRGTLNC